MKPTHAYALIENNVIVEIALRKSDLAEPVGKEKIVKVKLSLK